MGCSLFMPCQDMLLGPTLLARLFKVWCQLVLLLQMVGSSYSRSISRCKYRRSSYFLKLYLSRLFNSRPCLKLFLRLLPSLCSKLCSKVQFHLPRLKRRPRSCSSQRNLLLLLTHSNYNSQLSNSCTTLTEVLLTRPEAQLTEVLHTRDRDVVRARGDIG